MRAPVFICIAACFLAPLPAAAQSSAPKLAEARKLIDGLAYEGALKALDGAERTEDNDRESLLEIYRLQGICWGTLNRATKSQDAFRKLLMLDFAAAAPSEEMPPRVQTPFFEAKQWVSSNGPLGANVKVVGKSLTVTVEKDALGMARAARLHSRGVANDVPIKNGVAQTTLSEPGAEWWVELLGERRSVLMKIEGTDEPAAVTAPVVRREPQPSKLTSSRPDRAVTQHVEAPAQTQTVTTGLWRRPVGISLLGAGAAGAAVGIVLGVLSNDARNQVLSAEVDEAGRVVGMTQRRAMELETNSRGQATAANVLFVVSGAIAATGAVLVILGPSSEPTLALTPHPRGVDLAGVF